MTILIQTKSASIFYDTVSKIMHCTGLSRRKIMALWNVYLWVTVSSMREELKNS